MRTLDNAAEYEARSVESHLDRRAAELLPQPLFDSAGRPAYRLEPEVPETDFLPAAAVDDAIVHCLSRNVAGDILAEELAANPVPYERPERTVAACVDGVGVKKQKPDRKADAPKPPAKEKKKAWTTVARAQHAGASYTLTAPGVSAVLRLLSALLAASGLLDAPLLFFTDGERSLKDAILDFWAARGRFRIILDWYHLQHKCRELGSLGLAGSIAAKKVHIRALRRLLWYGLVDRAQAYIDALPPEAVRKPEVIEQIRGYIERNRPHIPCYAARKRLGLRCSSNPVEKDNDLVVAQRQKNNGMAWSEDGSHALSTLAAVRRNGETENWLRDGRLAFTLSMAA